MKTLPTTERLLREAATVFLYGLHQYELHDHPMVFEVLDTVAREQGLAISAEQKGIFGTRLKFVRVEDL